MIRSLQRHRKLTSPTSERLFQLWPWPCRFGPSISKASWTPSTLTVCCRSRDGLWTSIACCWPRSHHSSLVSLAPSQSASAGWIPSTLKLKLHKYSAESMVELEMALWPIQRGCGKNMRHPGLAQQRGSMALVQQSSTQLLGAKWMWSFRGEVFLFSDGMLNFVASWYRGVLKLLISSHLTTTWQTNVYICVWWW